MNAVFSILAGILSLLAGLTWFASTLVRVRAHGPAPREGEAPPRTISYDTAEMLAALHSQAKWNQLAALLACLAAFAQAIAAILSMS